LYALDYLIAGLLDFHPVGWRTLNGAPAFMDPIMGGLSARSVSARSFVANWLSV
jgi:hypothetical protein